LTESRVICWFSCGAASAAAAKMTVDKYGDRALVIYCDTMVSEHSDNERFFHDVQKWIGKPITVIRSLEYASVDDVFEKRKYMSGIHGAACTVGMKKVPRFEFQEPDDIHIFGFTVEEEGRIVKFEKENPELHLEWILRDNGVTKKHCLEALEIDGIAIPAMYLLGYKNNNCKGCVKATSPKYWNMVRRHFPDVFARRTIQSRNLGVRLARVKGVRVFIDEIPLEDVTDNGEDLSCGPQCGGNL
jgi:hypothetical protein